jgi:hypothetical protein
MVFIHPDYVCGVPSIKTKPVMKDSPFLPSMRTYFPDYHLHQDRERTDKPYCLDVFLKQRGSEPESPPAPASRKHECIPTGDSDNSSNLFGTD